MGFFIKVVLVGGFIIIGIMICLIMIKNGIQEDIKEKQREMAQAEQEKRMEQLNAEWERKQAEREALAEKVKKDTEAIVASIPLVDIDLSGQKGAVKDQNDIQDIRYNTITNKTNAFNLDDFVVIDVETTGLKKRDAIVSVGAVIFESGEPAKAFYTLVNPERAIPAEASNVNGIYDNDVEGAPTIWQIMPALQSFVGSLPIVGHNLPFDLGYLYRYGFDLGKNKRYDTLRLARRALDLDRYTLADCCQECGVPVVGAHNALYDCLMTGRLFAALTDRLINK